MLHYALVLLLCSIDVYSAHLKRSTGPVLQDHYIVVLKKGVDPSAHIEQISNAGGDNVISVKYTYNTALNGYNAKLTGEALNAVLADTNVEYVAEDALYFINNVTAHSPRTGSVHRTRALPSRRHHHPGGTGVDYYGLDTGIYTGNNEFGGRAYWGATFGGYADADGNGHGTGCASLAIGNTLGTAIGSNAYAVKVFPDSGPANSGDIIAGINWVMTAVSQSGRMSVMDLSFSGAPDDTLNAAVTNALNAGISVTTAAGDNSDDASNYSPGQVQGVNTVGATTQGSFYGGYDFASFSNYGQDVDIFAIGQDQYVAWIPNPDSYNTVQGTSVASSVVAGVLAWALSKLGPTSPADLSSAMVASATQLVYNVPPNTVNYIVQNFP